MYLNKLQNHENTMSVQKSIKRLEITNNNIEFATVICESIIYLPGDDEHGNQNRSHSVSLSCFKTPNASKLIMFN